MIKQKLILIILLLSVITISAEDVNIIPYLKQIESGDVEEAKKSLEELLSLYPEDPSVLFLDAVLTTNGEKALRKYINVYEKYPKSKYADASLYRMYSYYYALGFYKKATNYLEKLKIEYPSSPYIDAADKNLPENVGVFYEDEKSTIEPPKIAEEDKPEVKPTKKYLYSVQAGAFLDKKNANSLRKKLEAEGYSTELKTKDIGGSSLNVVMVGKFYTEQETDKLLSLLSTKYKLKGRIISLTN